MRKSLLPVTLAVCAILPPAISSTQQAASAKPAPSTPGVDADTGSAYVIIPMEGKLVTPSGIARAVGAESEEVPPHLTGQCSRDSNGKYSFELLADFGGLNESPYYRPWRPSEMEKHPPHYTALPITMEYFGYTKVKPFKRQWQALPRPLGQYRYDQPGGSSSNMETVVFFMKYLLALPTLRLTGAGKSAQFETAEWQKRVREDPLCKASGL